MMASNPTYKFIQHIQFLLDDGSTIIIPVPEEWKRRRLDLILGNHFAQYCPKNHIVLVKTQECNQCGLCCLRLPMPQKEFQNAEGRCKFVVQNSDGTYACGLYGMIPWGCFKANPSEQISECSLKYKEVSSHGD